MATVDAVEVGNTHAAITITAGGRDLVRALRAKVELGVNTGPTRGAQRNNWLAKQKIKHCSDSTRQDQADKHPQARAHGAARRIATYVTRHQHIERCERAPGEREVEAQAERSRGWLQAVGGQDYPEKVLHENKRQSCRCDRPAGDECDLFGKG